METKDELLKKKILGFKFKSDEYISYVPKMDEYIGKEGIIVGRDDRDYEVKFSNEKKWWYPGNEIENHLIETDLLEDFDLDEIFKQIKGK